MASQKIPRGSSVKRDRRLPVGVGGSGDQTFTFSEDQYFDDDETMAFDLALPETAQYEDAVLVALGSWQQGRSATPDADRWGDSWGEQASPNATHGNEDLQLVGTANASKRPLLHFDLTGLAGLEARPGGTHNLLLRINNPSGTSAFNVTCQFDVSRIARPFDESLVTWNTMPAHVSSFGVTISVPANSTAVRTFPISDANVNLMLGKWVYVQMICTSLVSVLTVTSRDGATASHRPTLNLDLKGT